MKSFADIMLRDIKAMRLDAIDHDLFDSFEEATEEISNTFERDMKAYDLKYDQIENKINTNYEKFKTYESEEQLRLLDEQIDCERQKDYIRNYLTALAEMKIIYLFKSLEQTIKYLVTSVYGNVNTKQFFKWDFAKDFLKSKGIQVSELNGHLEWTQLMRVNNSIKHEGSTNDQIKQIPEFSELVYFDHVSLNTFYKRVHVKAINFCKIIKEEIKKEWYLFSNERLENLADEYS